MYVGSVTPPSLNGNQAVNYVTTDAYDFCLVDLRLKFAGLFDDFIDIRGVSSESFGSSVVGKVVTDSTAGDQRAALQGDVKAQMNWAAHAGMYAVVIDLSMSDEISMSAVISGFCDSHPPEQSVTRVWVQCTAFDWGKWNQIRTMCGNPSKLSVCLTYDPALFSDSILMSRWLGEPVSSILFLGSECAPSSHACLLSLFRRNAQPIVTSPSLLSEITGILSSAPRLKWSEEYVAPYHDSLQLPLQPLADNMENNVYETFETDRTKYELYEEAVFRAINELATNHPRDTLFRLAVVGAGRGGLVDAALRAIDRGPLTVSQFEIFAIEKNPNAARTLKFRCSDDWAAKVTVVETDMREWNCGGQIDILISELLGSLGDNEASPECIDGVIRVVNPVRGICIPSRYYSSLEPVSCAKVWMAARDAGKLETPLVVNFHTVFRPATPCKLFSFEDRPSHPSSSNERSCTLSWIVKESDFTLHGFAGYFHCDLHGGVTMSTHPPTATVGMVSWFPAFLPLKDPVLVAAGETVTVHVARRCEKAKIFFEWTLLKPLVSCVHNKSGTSHSIGL